ncbi:glycosyltransferase family 4 protein [Roseomonas marmotae]|uniref:Glycosyltransferase family 4 protein n=2 Tax=Roseomonas marmotae TaxID=2768161 RepID=A0ABS3KHS6_9PROT|nr:glycosyltransferase family 4 protein [Roseomonas marmotae]MBO1076995.1 glycosyltransferase family 4 protein [Roseomonas marmotae]QTI80796.1 glycosyltransferase family 4 protein [Roseomonas marmotae]
MRILYLHQHYSGPAGATATRSHAMARALSAAGHQVTIACGQYAGAVTGLAGPFRAGRREGVLQGVRLVEFAIPCGNHQGFARRLCAFGHFAAAATRLALAEGWDLIIASSTPLTVAIPALLARRLRGTPFVFEIRDPWPELPRAMGAAPPLALAAMEPLASAACRQAAMVVALSEGMAGTAQARGADPARVRVVPNGCDLDLFGPQVAPWRPPGVAAWEMLAVYAGAHGRANGLDQLLDAAAILQARRERRIRLLLVGEGGEKARLRLLAEARGLGNLTFLDSLPKRRLAALLAGAQVGVQCLAPVPEFAEWTAPNKLMDYLAAGLPVVANLSGRAARLLADGPCGIAAPPGDAAALADALVWMADNPARRAELGAAGRAQALRRWDRRLLAADFVQAAEAAGATSAAPMLVTA